MAKHIRALLFLSLSALLLPQSGSAQAVRRELLPGSRVWVSGTSNKSEWTVNTTSVSGFVVLDARDSLTIQAGSFTVPAKSLVSEHGVIMDRLMYGALKSAEHPDIVYQLASAAVSAAGPGTYTLATSGTATIAGVTKPVEQTVQAERLPNGQLRFTGSQPVLMNDFGMTPPTAMFGALRTGNRVVVHFELLVKP